MGLSILRTDNKVSTSKELTQVTKIWPKELAEEVQLLRKEQDSRTWVTQVYHQGMILIILAVDQEEDSRIQVTMLEALSVQQNLRIIRTSEQETLISSLKIIMVIHTLEETH